MARFQHPVTLMLCLLLLGAPAMAAPPDFNARVSEANRYAQADNYARAVEIYEQLRTENPSDKLLESNWKVLAVNYGVQLQGEGKYPEAEALFKQVLTVDPENKHAVQSLAGNYFHEGLDLREKGSKNYEQMRTLFQMAHDLYPDQSVFLQAKGAIYFDEAMDIAQNAANDTDRAKALPLLESAHQLNPANNDIVRSIVNLSLDLAKYEEDTGKREDLLLRVLSLDPSDGTQELVAKIRESHDTPAPDPMAIGNGETTDTAIAETGDSATNDSEDDSKLSKKERRAREKAAREAAETRKKEDRLKKKKTEAPVAQQPDNPQTRETAGPAKAPPKTAMAQMKAQKNELPASAAKLSLQEMMMDIENQLGLPVNTKASLKDRLTTAEMAAMGDDDAKTQSGPLTDRIRNLYALLMGKPKGDAGNTLADTMMQAAPAFSRDSYLDEIFKVTNGYVIRWSRFPVRVYIDEPKNNKLFRDGFMHSAEAGIRVWKLATYGDVTYTVVKNERAADIVVKWADDYVDRYADAETVPDFYKNYSPPGKMTNNMMRVLQVASMLTPGVYGVAPQALGAALQYRQAKKLDAVREESIITLGLKPTAGLPEKEALILVQNMMAKEFGHALGLKGQSPTEGDLMYPELRADKLQTPTKRDVATLNDLYNRPANIVLNVN
ncbi:MAG: hypothetical protein AB7P76_12060 [Candidatus Melainabacteria bacterium]